MLYEVLQLQRNIRIYFKDIRMIHNLSSVNIPWLRMGPLIEPYAFQWNHYPDLSLGVMGIDTKDPCPIYDEYGQLHIYGSVGRDSLGWWLFHATWNPKGKWVEELPVRFHGIEGGSIAAPGMAYDNGIFHMFIQTDCFELGGNIEHLISTDGQNFRYLDTPHKAKPNSVEAGVYDPHPAIIYGKKYIVYSAMAERGKPDTINLLSSVDNSWYGPWKPDGQLLKQHEIAWHHNQPDQPEYEWGVEGAQLLELPNGLILMNAVCFLPYGDRGTRQRTFFAFAEGINGPYYSVGPMLNPQPGWEEGENGHSAVLVEDGIFKLFYQARQDDDHAHPWRYGLALCKVEEIMKLGEMRIQAEYKKSGLRK